VIGQPVVDWVMQKMGGDYGPSVGIGVENAGEIVGAVVFCAYNKASMFIHVASNGTVAWANKEWFFTLFDYAFNQARVNTLIGPISEKNHSARRFTERVGFTLTAEIPDAHPDGKLLIYTMHRKQCRWLRNSNVEAFSTART